MTSAPATRETRVNSFMPEPMRIVRMYNLTPDVKFFQVRAVDIDRAMTFDYKPGQFAMISLPNVGEAPFCISSTPTRPGLLEFCIRKAGSLTSAIFRLKENAVLGVRGPYGNGFPMERMEGKDVMLIMGGMGVAPLRSVLLYCLDDRDRFRNVTLLNGAKRPGDMIFRDEFLALKQREDLDCHLTVDGDDTGCWCDNVGVVTTLFRCIKPVDPENTFAVVCGPPVMYKFVIRELLELHVPKDQILMTLERRMKCGVGKCGHCAIDYVYTCLDGPVFTYWDVIHMRELI